MAAEPTPAARSGRPDVEELWREHGRRVYAFVHRLVGGDAADDACQEVWVAIVKALPRFRGEAKVTTWMFAIAARVCRRQRARLRPVETAGEAGLDAVADEGRGPETRALDKELRRLVRRAIDDLPAGQREVVHLRQVEGCSYAEIARILGIPEGTVCSRLHLGMARLADSLAPYLETADEAD